MVAEEVKAGLEVGGFETVVTTVQGDWVVRWKADNAEVGMCRFAELPKVLEFKALNVEADHQGNGIFTQCVRFGLAHGGIRIAADTPAREFYEQVGWKVDGGWLVSEKPRQRRWLKGR